MNRKTLTYPDSFLEPENMIKLYALGAFPMAESAESNTINWYMPEVRTIIPVEKMHIPRSLRKFMQSWQYEIRYDTDFTSVLEGCSNREETWISQKLIDAYMRLYTQGYIHTVEVYQHNELVGGLYGVAYKGAFFGESMFSTVSQASKVALAHLLYRLKNNGFLILDVQYETQHLAMFGTIQLGMEEYNHLLREAYKKEIKFTD